MNTTYSRAQLATFLDTLSSKGLAKANTAQALRVACGKILVDLSEAEEADVRKVDVDLAIRKFHNKNPGALSPASLAEYKRRVGLAIREFEAYQENPTTYRGLGGPPSSKKSESHETEQPRKRQPKQEQPVAPAVSESPPQPAGGLTLAFPLRSDFLVQLVLPRDIKSDETERLCAFIRTLAMDFKPRMG
jgi:hypothetical protein